MRKTPHDREDPLTLVELFGLPGAGKTTMVAAYAKHAFVTTRHDLSAQWVRSSILRRLAYLSSAIMNVEALRTALHFALSARLSSWESAYRLVRLVGKTSWLRSRSGVVLLDQGFLQEIWSILVASKSASANPALLSELIRSLYRGMNATIVAIDVNCDTASARVWSRARGGSRFDKLPEGELLRSIEAVSGFQQQILQSARLAGMQVTLIDGSAPLEIMTRHFLVQFPVGRAQVAGEA